MAFNKDYDVSDIGDKVSWEIYRAVNRGDLDAVKQYVQKGDITLNTVLHTNLLSGAATYGHLKVLVYLMEHFNLTLSDKSVHNNAIMRQAALEEHVDIVKYLLSRIISCNNSRLLNEWIDSASFSSQGSDNAITRYLENDPFLQARLREYLATTSLLEDRLYKARVMPSFSSMKYADNLYVLK